MPKSIPSSAGWANWTSWEKARLRWRLKARPEQLTPPGGWLVWFLLGGRGAGKTRAGAEDISDYCRTHPGSRVALVGPTFADVRDTMVEGEAGLLAVLPATALAKGSREYAWNRSLGELRLANGCILKGFAAETPERLRGPQHHRAWVEEPASFADAAKGDALNTAWNNLMLGLRLGADPRCIVTGTPKPLALIRQILANPHTHVSRSSTYDNLANLAPSFAAQVLERYEGTRIGRQELHAELLDDVEGALWQRSWIDETRVSAVTVPLSRTVVALDPADGTADGDEQAIVVASLGLDHRYYVRHSEGVRMSPDAWLRRAVALYEDYQADRVVIEANHGGRFLVDLLRTVAPELPTRIVHASEGKRTRAEPISALFEQGRVSHVGAHDLLEAQMCSFSGAPGERSPDRLDALVWAMAELAGSRRKVTIANRGAA